MAKSQSNPTMEPMFRANRCEQYVTVETQRGRSESGSKGGTNVSKQARKPSNKGEDKTE